MAGQFQYISKEHPLLGGFSSTKDSDQLVWRGHTHGCGCCSEDFDLSVNDLREHVRQLYKDIDQANEALKDMGAAPEPAPEKPCACRQATDAGAFKMVAVRLVCAFCGGTPPVREKKT